MLPFANDLQNCAHLHSQYYMYLLLLISLIMTASPYYAWLPLWRRGGSLLACYLTLTGVKWPLHDEFILLICLQHEGIQIIQCVNPILLGLLVPLPWYALRSLQPPTLIPTVQT